MGCGGGATEAGLPERDVSLEAVGVEGEAHVRVGALALRVPAEALGVVQARWAEARFELGPAPVGASAESLATEEARALSALHPDAEIGRSRARFAGRPAIRLAVLREGEVVREVLVALRSPWRKARVVVDGGGLDAFLAGRQLELAGLALGITAPATLELAAPRWSVRLAEAGGG
ncbi:MAG TPA: hypothetical protein RMG95_27230, partial [Polyangiaceae bacterium LLY-WYZ-15_(1-7)]|nr:hypothetical protein [Polyangiaceae bacterium LLY-WYZ-15_(1-7)]HJL50692.1 hypothetical protein [Polyangiaceae bacterium LLY-WYZ-15_(1-7)]